MSQNQSSIPVDFLVSTEPSCTRLKEAEILIKAINRLCLQSHEVSVEKHWWDAERNNGELLMLMVSELGEALEGLRHGNPPSEHIPEFSAVEEELADACIRIFDMAAARGYRLGEAIITKMEFNRTRPIKHGGKLF